MKSANKTGVDSTAAASGSAAQICCSRQHTHKHTHTESELHKSEFVCTDDLAY